MIIICYEMILCIFNGFCLAVLNIQFEMENNPIIGVLGNHVVGADNISWGLSSLSFESPRDNEIKEGISESPYCEYSFYVFLFQYLQVIKLPESKQSNVPMSFMRILRRNDCDGGMMVLIKLI